MLKELVVKVELLKLAVRRELLQMLGVDKMVERAFKEGYSMQLDNFHNGEVYRSTTWKTADEAWVNSNALEEFE